jgi:hypothetical protein
MELCPHCDASVSARAAAEGWCDGCGKILPVHIT